MFVVFQFGSALFIESFLSSNSQHHLLLNYYHFHCHYHCCILEAFTANIIDPDQTVPCVEQSDQGPDYLLGS